MNKILMMLGLVIAANAQAREWHVQLHGLSYHSIRTQANGAKWNEQNIGVGIRYQLTDVMDVQVGAYRNSEFRTSTYAIATWLPVEVGSVRVGVFGGVANGYRANDGRAVPAGGLAARWQGDRLSLTSRFIPKHPKSASAAVTIELGIKF